MVYHRNPSKSRTSASQSSTLSSLLPPGPEKKAPGWNAGWRVVGGRRIFFRSRWECNYARYLEWLKQRGEIRDWHYEPETFWFERIKRGVRSYKPDFLVIELGGEQIFHEVKGWMDPESKTKLKRMRIYHPHVRIILIEEKTFRSIKRNLYRLIENWE